MKKNKLWSWPYIYILVLYCFVQMVLYMITPVLSKYILNMGESNSIAGIIAGAFSITALLIRPFSGYLADRFHKKRLLTFSLLLTFLSLAGYYAAAAPWQIFLFRLCQGGAYAVSTTVMMAMVSEVVDVEIRGAGIGYYALAATLAQAVGPGIGLKVVECAGYRKSILLAAFIAMAAVGASFFQPFREEVKEKAEAPKLEFGSLIAKEVLALAGFSCLFSLSNGLMSNFISVLGDERGILNISLYFTVNAVIMAVTKPLSGRLTDRYGLHYIMYGAYFFCATALYLLAGARSLAVVLGVAVLYGIGVGAGQPALQAQSTKEVKIEQVGIAVSTCYLGNDIGQGIGPALGGMVSDRFGYGAMFFCAALLHTAAFFLFYFYEKKARIARRTFM